MITNKQNVYYEEQQTSDDDISSTGTKGDDDCEFLREVNRTKASYMAFSHVLSKQYVHLKNAADGYDESEEFINDVSREDYREDMVLKTIERKAKSFRDAVKVASTLRKSRRQLFREKWKSRVSILSPSEQPHIRRKNTEDTIVSSPSQPNMAEQQQQQKKTGLFFSPSKRIGIFSPSKKQRKNIFSPKPGRKYSPLQQQKSDMAIPAKQPDSSSSLKRQRRRNNIFSPQRGRNYSPLQEQKSEIDTPAKQLDFLSSLKLQRKRTFNPKKFFSPKKLFSPTKLFSPKISPGIFSPSKKRSGVFSPSGIFSPTKQPGGIFSSSTKQRSYQKMTPNDS